MADPLPDPGAPGSDDSDALAELEQVLLRLPGLSKLVGDVRELRALLVERRPPRVAAIGRRGAGKSSLANALLGAEVLPTGAVADTTAAATWVDLVHEGRRLRWLDTPGLRAGEAPERREQVRQALAHEPPDVILLAVRATQVDSGIDEDVAEVKWLLERQKHAGLVEPAVVAVLTRVDELAPVTVKTPPFREDKRANIDQAVAVLRRHLERTGIAVQGVVPVSAYLRSLADRTLVVDWRWNLEALANAVFTALPPVAQVEAARAFECSRVLRRRVAMRIVGLSTSVAFFVGITPLPFADLALLAPLQSAMVTGVVLLGRQSADKRTAAEWLASLGVNVGAGWGLREAARALLKLVPGGLGGSISGAVAATGTWALGLSAVRYFIDGSSVDDAKAAFEQARRAGAPTDPGRAGEDAAETDREPSDER